MRSDVDYDTLNDALRRCGATWDAAQAHGLLSSRLAVAGADAGRDWLQQVLEGTSESDALQTECAAMLNALFQDTQRQLSERLSEFAPLLPDDSDTASARAVALAHWCEGFLHGLVSINHGETLRERLARDPLADIIRDMQTCVASRASRRPKPARPCTESPAPVRIVVPVTHPVFS